jgi:hypothetical protein
MRGWYLFTLASEVKGSSGLFLISSLMSILETRTLEFTCGISVGFHEYHTCCENYETKLFESF